MVKKIISKNEFVNKHKQSSQDFSRNRVFTFQTTFLFICSFLHKRTQTELDTFFSKLQNTSESLRTVTSSSFTQIRDKISFTAFKSVFEEISTYFYENHSFKTYLGFKIVAIDGSVFTLPRTPKTIEEFGENVLSSNRKWIKAQVSFAVDVLNNICLDASIQAYKDSERDMASAHMLKLSGPILYLFDRGYFSKKMLLDAVNSQSQFCFRVQKKACKEVIDFIKDKQRDIIVIIKCDDKEVKVRLTKIRLKNGEDEYLLSSLLDKKAVSRVNLKKIYAMRWGVEEQFKDVKHAICIENFKGKKPNSIKQEFYGNILTYNLSMMLCKSDIDHKANLKSKKYYYQTNKRALLAKIKNCFVKIFFLELDCIRIINEIIESVLKESIPMRKGRVFKRNKTFKAKIKQHNNYVSVL